MERGMQVSRLPTPKIVEIQVMPDGNIEERKKIFFSMMRTAIVRKHIAEQNKKGGE